MKVDNEEQSGRKWAFNFFSLHFTRFKYCQAKPFQSAFLFYYRPQLISKLSYKWLFLPTISTFTVVELSQDDDVVDMVNRNFLYHSSYERTRLFQVSVYACDFDGAKISPLISYILFYIFCSPSTWTNGKVRSHRKSAWRKHTWPKDLRWWGKVRKFMLNVKIEDEVKPWIDLNVNSWDGFEHKNPLSQYVKSHECLSL